MSEIFTDLPSPEPPTFTNKFPNRAMLEHALESGEAPGMRSTLYSYQRQSVAAMLYREQAKATIRNPLFVEIKTIDDQNFYFQPGTMEIRSECPMAYQEKGGMLCEELGNKI